MSIVTADRLKENYEFPVNYVQTTDTESAYSELIKNLPEYVTAITNEANQNQSIGVESTQYRTKI